VCRQLRIAATSAWATQSTTWQPPDHDLSAALNLPQPCACAKSTNPLKPRPTSLVTHFDFVSAELRRMMTLLRVIDQLHWQAERSQKKARLRVPCVNDGKCGCLSRWQRDFAATVGQVCYGSTAGAVNT
jgi:hypothetical protein